MALLGCLSSASVALVAPTVIAVGLALLKKNKYNKR